MRRRRLVEELTSAFTVFVPVIQSTLVLRSVGRPKSVERTSKGKWKHTRTGYILIKGGGVWSMNTEYLPQRH